MDSEIAHPHSHPNVHPSVGGEEEHHEKKSVIKKVKDKAKKIKDTLKKHGHGQEHGHIEHDEEDEYDEDEEIVQDPEILGPPMYESVAAKNFASGQGVDSAQSGVKMGHKSPLDGNPDQNVCPGTFQSPVTDPHPSATTAPIHDSAARRDFAERQDVNLGKSKFTMGEHFGEDSNAPKHKHKDVFPTNYADPRTGHGEVAGVAPILRSFDKMKIYDEPQHDKEATGSHALFSPSPTTSSDFVSHKINPIPENTPLVPVSFGATTETSHDMNVAEPTTQRQAGYTDKISSVTSAIAEKAMAAKNVAASKIGYGGNNDDAQTQKDMNVDEPPTQRQPDYTDKISSVTSAITDKAISAKNAVASKIGYGGNNDNVQTQKDGENVTSAGVPVASTENLSATESAREPVKNQTTYTEKLAGATSALAGTAVSAKNAVASKLGYGGGDSTGYGGGDKTAAAVGTEANRDNDNEKSTAGGVTGYGRQIASTVTDKLAPVYGTVAGAGSAVLSKIPGTGMGSVVHKNTGEDTGTGTPRETGTGVVGETDKGVVGMKGYIAEKLKPSEEDRALSEVISDALNMRQASEHKADEKREMGAVAFHKRNNEDDMYRENKPMGKVTESDEVAHRLGSSEEEKSGKVAGSDSPGTGVVDKFKGAFTNWFGKGGETNPSQAFNDNQAHESQGTAGERESES